MHPDQAAGRKLLAFLGGRNPELDLKVVLAAALLAVDALADIVRVNVAEEVHQVVRLVVVRDAAELASDSDNLAGLMGAA